MKTRLIKEIGTRYWLRIYWGDDCPNCGGHGGKGCHNAMKHIGDVPEIAAWNRKGKVSDYPAEQWPTNCEDCGAPVPKGVPSEAYDSNGGPNWQVFSKRLYNTASGKPEPGDLFYADWHHRWREGRTKVVFSGTIARALI